MNLFENVVVVFRPTQKILNFVDRSTKFHTKSSTFVAEIHMILVCSRTAKR